MVSNVRHKLKKGDPTLARQTLDLLNPSLMSTLNNENSRNFRYDEKIAALLASVAGWSYAELSDFERILSDNKQINLSEADFVQVSAENDSLLLVATAQIIRTSDKKTAIVCFRGTEPTNIVNFGTDLNTKKVFYLDEDKKIKVHQGFLANFRAVWDGMEGILAHLKDPSKIGQENGVASSEDDELEAIYFTGHSLGGAMAFLAGLYVSFVDRETNGCMWEKVRGIYTYGQPMVIDPMSTDFCDSLIGDRLFRMVYYNDIVPHVPPVSTGLYAHIGHEYRYRPWPWHGWKEIQWGKVTQLLVALPTIPFLAWDAVGGVIVSPFALFKSPWSVLDHSPTNYIDTLHGLGPRNVRGLLTLGGLTVAEDEVVEDQFHRHLINDSAIGTTTVAAN